MPGAELPDAAAILLHTRILNRFTGAGYTCEQVARLDPILFEVIDALEQGLNPST